MKREDLYMRSFRGEDGFNEFIADLGGDPVAITKMTKLAPALPEGLINFESFAEVCKLFETAAEQTNEPYFGLKWALHQPEDFRFSGPNIILLSLAKNTRHWIDMAIDYQKIHTNGMSYHYEEDLDAQTATGVASVHPFAPPCRQMVEQFAAGLVLLSRQMLPDVKFHLITFQHSAPEDLTLYEQIFQCPVEFNADRITFVSDHRHLEERKTALLTKIVTPLAKKYMDWQLSKFPKAAQSMSMAVSEIIPGLMGIKGSDIQHVAQTLNMHPKKLQRILKDEKTSYSEVLDTVRKHTAMRLLSESDISIVRLAKMLDYSSDRPFTTATKRWFGMSASQYRRSQKSRPWQHKPKPAGRKLAASAHNTPNN